MNRFKYGSTKNDTELTDNFIASIVNDGSTSGNNKNESSKKKKSDDADMLDAWYHSHLSRYGDAAGVGGGQSDGSTCAKYGLYFLNGLFMLVGIALVVAGVMMRSSDTMHFCKKCTNLAIAPICFGAFIVLTAVIGIYGVLRRGRCLLLMYLMFLLIVVVSLVVLLVTALVFNFSEPDLSGPWHSAVRNEPSFVCDIQNALECSGFDSGCCDGPVRNHTTTSSPQVHLNRIRVLQALASSSTNTTAPQCYSLDANGYPPAWVNQTCVAGCSANKYRAQCKTVLKDDLKKKLGVFTGVVGGAVVLFLLGVVLAVKRRRA
eukprot:PhM_4_TR4252/c0_g1_i1/m.64253